MPARWKVTPNHDGMGFSNGLSPDENGDFVSFRDYEKLERAYNVLAEEMTAAQGQIADYQAAIERGDKATKRAEQLRATLEIYGNAVRDFSGEGFASDCAHEWLDEDAGKLAFEKISAA